MVRRLNAQTSRCSDVQTSQPLRAWLLAEQVFYGLGDDFAEVELLDGAVQLQAFGDRDREIDRFPPQRSAVLSNDIRARPRPNV